MIVDIAFLVLLPAWFLATVFANTPLFRRYDVKKFVDPLDVLVLWKIFAPVPISQDVHFLVRPVENGAPGKWVEVVEPPKRRFFHTFLFPSNRSDHALSRLSGAFFESQTDRPMAETRASAYYAGLRYLAERSRPEVAQWEGWQFLVMTSSVKDSTDRQYSICFLSDIEHSRVT